MKQILIRLLSLAWLFVAVVALVIVVLIASAWALALFVCGIGLVVVALPVTWVCMVVDWFGGAVKRWRRA